MGFEDGVVVEDYGKVDDLVFYCVVFDCVGVVVKFLLVLIDMYFYSCVW